MNILILFLFAIVAIDVEIIIAKYILVRIKETRGNSKFYIFVSNKVMIFDIMKHNKQNMITTKFTFLGMSKWSRCPEIVRTYPKIKTFYTAIEAAGLMDTFSGDGPFTFYAPSDDAFSKNPSILDPKNISKLRKVLLRHVIPFDIKPVDGTNDIKKLKKNGTVDFNGRWTIRLASVGGEKIDLIYDDCRLTFIIPPIPIWVKMIRHNSSKSSANVVDPHIGVLTTNGYIYIVDSFLDKE